MKYALAITAAIFVTLIGAPIAAVGLMMFFSVITGFVPNFGWTTLGCAIFIWIAAFMNYKKKYGLQ